MKIGPGVGLQFGLNIARALPNVVVSASIVLGSGSHASTTVYATERKTAFRINGLGFDGQAELDPESIAEPRPVSPVATAMYKATWRTVPDPAIIQRLKEEGIFWFEGGPTEPGSSRKRLHLDPKIGHRRQAELICKWTIQRAGGDPSDLTVELPNTERIRRGVEACHRFDRQEVECPSA